VPPPFTQGRLWGARPTLLNALYRAQKASATLFCDFFVKDFTDMLTPCVFPRTLALKEVLADDDHLVWAF
jgi:hypothetical protein